MRNGYANIFDQLAFMANQLSINYYYNMPIAYPKMDKNPSNQRQTKLHGGLAFDWPNNCIVCCRHRIFWTLGVAEGSKGHNELCPFKEKPVDPDIIRWIEAQNPLPKHFQKEKERRGMSRQTKINNFFVVRKRRDKAGTKWQTLIIVSIYSY